MAVLIPVAHAQDTSSLSLIEEIMITGEKRDRTLFDTTTSVSATTGEDIDERDIQNLRDILLQIPNVNQQNGGDGFAIRGVSNTSVTGAGTGPLATLYIDGAQISQLGISAGQSDLWDIAQVEVFRGAQSLIQGRNSLAGSIQIRSQDPIHDFEIKGRVQYAEDQTYNLSAAINVPLINDQLAFRFGIDHKESDGFITNATLNRDNYSRTRNTLYRGKLLFEPGIAPQFRALVTVSYSDNAAGDDVVDAAQPFRHQIFSNLQGRENLDQFISTLELGYEFNDTWRVATTSSYNEADYNSFTDDDQSASGGENSRTSQNEVETFSQELRFHYDHDWLKGHFGAYFLHEDNTADALFVSGISIPSVLPPEFQAIGPFIAPFYADPFLTDSSSDDHHQTTNYVGFFDFDTNITHFITLHSGLRYDRENQDNNIRTTLAFGSPLPDLANIPAGPGLKILYAVMGLFMSALIVLGLAIWLEQRQRPRLAQFIMSACAGLVLTTFGAFPAILFFPALSGAIGIYYFGFWALIIAVTMLIKRRLPQTFTP